MTTPQLDMFVGAYVFLLLCVSRVEQSVFALQEAETENNNKEQRYRGSIMKAHHQ